MAVRSRFAPSPSGYLHLGHAFSALSANEVARRDGGDFILRIEDTDRVRSKPEFEQAIYDDLSWLGLVWETPVRRQSDHLEDYQVSLDQLRAQGLVYRCFKTRKEVLADIERAPHHHGEGPDGRVYFGPDVPLSDDEESERVAKGESYAWRLSLERCRDALGHRFDGLAFEERGNGPEGQSGRVAIDANLIGDVILARKDAPVAYHLSCVHDDGLQSITDIVRGEDLFFATQAHVLLQAVLSLPTPVYHHHRLLTGPDGKRYAKRNRSVTLKALRERGHSASDIASMIGWSSPI